MFERLSPAALLFMAGVLTGCAGDDLTLPGDVTPASLTMVSGDGQQGRAGEVLNDPLVVQLTDAAGEPTPGAEVIFLGIAGEPQAVPAIDTTDAHGHATTRARLGASAGDQVIEARVTAADPSLSVQFSVTALATRDSGGSPDPGAGGGGDGQDGGNGKHHDKGKGKGHGHGNGDGND